MFFRDNINPSGGNNDAIRTSLVNLLLFASQVKADTRAHQDYRLDVMHFIYSEMYDAMVSGTSIPYAPYIMMLIKHTMNEWDFPLSRCTPHEMKYPYVKKKVPKPIPSYSEVEQSQGTFMADARRSGARRSSGAHGEAVPPRSVAKEMKELN